MAVFYNSFDNSFRDFPDKSSEACIDGIELLISNLPCTQRQPATIKHIRSDASSEFRSDVFRKWCSENKIYFNSNIASTSTETPNGKLFVLTAALVCIPASPKTEAIRSDAPFNTLG